MGYQEDDLERLHKNMKYVPCICTNCGYKSMVLWSEHDTKTLMCPRCGSVLDILTEGK